MAKLILFSILVVTIVLPMALAGDPRPRRGARRTVRYMLGYIVLWVLACSYLYPRLL